ncbi:MAG: RHS repeat protein, partial [Caldisericia bacterium]|nr:RHS repeat protein [Caldisericia bacterium]
MNIARLGIKNWLCGNNSSKKQTFLLHKSILKYIVLFTVFSMVFSTIPLSFANAVTSESYWHGNGYPLSLIENGSNSAGRKSSDAEFIFHTTSKWTTIVADLESGNLLFIANIFELSGTSLIVPFGLTYNSFNSTEDIGLGKGWMSNLHSCVFENTQTGSITYMTSSGAKIEFEYDSQNQNYKNPYGFKGKIEKTTSGYQVTLLGGSTMNFDTSGKLVSVEPACGIGYTISYSNGRPSEVTDNLNQNCKYTLAWNTNGKLLSVTDGMNHIWALVYNQNETQLVSIIQPNQESYSCSFSYDIDNLLTGHNDFHGIPYTISYNTNSPKQISYWTVPTNNKTTFTYSTPSTLFSKKTEVSDPENSKTNYLFGIVSNKLEKISQTENNQELKKTFSYNTSGWVTSSKDSYENEKVYIYDNVGNLIKSINPPAITGGAQYSIERTYSPSNDVLGLLTSSKEKASPNLWNETTYLYEDIDAPCKPSKIINALAEETTIDYNSFGQIISVTKQTQTGVKTETNQYDPSNGKLISSSNYSGNETSYVYNNNGKEIQKSIFEGTIASGTPVNSTSTTRDEYNYSISTNDSITNEVTTSIFGKNGELNSVTNKSGCSSSIVYTKAINSVLTIAPSKNNKTSPVDSSVFPNSILVNHISSINLQSTPRYSPNYYSQTDSMDHNAEFAYKSNGLLNTLNNHLGYLKTYSYDSVNRLNSITQPDGNDISISYNNNCLKTNISSDSNGTTLFTYDNCSRVVTKNDPVSGLLTYSYTVRGDILADETGSYSYDIIGRKTSVSYADGTTDSWSYTNDGYLSSQNGINRTFDLSGNALSWDNGTNSASYSYQGGFSSLGLPSNITGQVEISSYGLQYNQRHLLGSIDNTSKTMQGIFAYTYSDQNKLTSLSNPNNTQLNRTYSNKLPDKILVNNTQTQEKYLDIDTDFNENDQRTSYKHSVPAGQNLFTETNTISYKTGNYLGKVDSISSLLQNRSISYGYNSLNGLINSLEFSDLGTFGINHNNNGTLSSFSYPNNQGSASFVYNAAFNKLSGITLPDNKNISLSWNSKNLVTGITCNNVNSTTTYSMSYNNNNQITYLKKTEDGTQLNYWTFYYGPNGLEKASKFDYSLGSVSITQDFTTDTRGRLLSMTYSNMNAGSQPTNEEYYFHSDAFGNICLLTNSNGQPVASYQYDLHGGKVLNKWNPDNIENQFMQSGFLGAPSISLPLDSNGNDYIVIPRNSNIIEIGLDPGLIVIDIPTKGVDLRHNPWKGIKILSEDEEECKPCPEGEYHVWTCTYKCYEFSPSKGDGEFLAIEQSEDSEKCSDGYYTLKNFEGRDVKVHCILCTK